MLTMRFLLSAHLTIGVLSGCADDAMSNERPPADSGSINLSRDSGMDASDHCAGGVCPDRINCARGTVLVALEGACCPSCETVPVDAGHGCLCSPERDLVCGEDLMVYQNHCFAGCARVEVIAAGPCPSRAQFPPGNYGETCGGDEACDTPYECLPAAHGDALDPERRICASRCKAVQDCPRVVSDHCGDQTVCTDGICGFFLCL